MKNELKKRQHRKGERGNVLFLILIAVALFAALSYAVTSSSRSGGGNANEESSLVNSASITQYPASVRTSIIRMMVSNGIDAQDLAFDPPPYTDCTGANLVNCVFHPTAGGGTYAPSSAEVVTTGSPQDWVFNAENEIRRVGLDGSTEDTALATTAEIIAFLPNVTNGICRKINEELGIGSTIPVETGIDVSTNMTVSNAGFGAGGGTIGDYTTATGTPELLNAQPFGCFEQASVNYYYHVLIEQ